jgi:hypothetical protein
MLSDQAFENESARILHDHFSDFEYSFCGMKRRSSVRQQKNSKLSSKEKSNGYAKLNSNKNDDSLLNNSVHENSHGQVNNNVHRKNKSTLSSLFRIFIKRR